MPATPGGSREAVKGSLLWLQYWRPISLNRVKYGRSVEEERRLSTVAALARCMRERGEETQQRHVAGQKRCLRLDRVANSQRPGRLGESKGATGARMRVEWEWGVTHGGRQLFRLWKI